MRKVALAAAGIGLVGMVPTLANLPSASASGVPLLVYSGQDYAAAVFAGILSRKSSSRLAWVIDVGLLSAVALPSLVLGASFIFAYNLPLVAHMGIHLTGMRWLLGAADLAGNAAIVARLILGSVAQFQASLVAAARVHGVPPVIAWVKVVLPLLARPLMWAWLVAFGGIALELPVSQILEPPGHQAIAVAITSEF